MPPTKPALLGSSQKRTRGAGLTSPQFMFPSQEMNFEKGGFTPSSKNAAQQNLFNRNDPFAKAVAGVGTAANQAPAGVSSVLDVAVAQANAQGGGGEAPLVEPVQSNPLNFARPDSRDDPANFSKALGANAQLVKPVTPLDLATNPIGVAAQTLGAVLLNNPFISPKGRQALREGRVPQMNDIQPAFFRFTSPNQIAQLQGLMSQADQVGGTSPTQSDLDFFANVFTAPSL